jgi:Undecaprenyl-phosphate glucose phosphotransferase
MNYIKRDFGRPGTVAVRHPKTTARRPRAWTIPHTAVAPLAMLLDGLIIFTMSVFSDLAYELYTIGRIGDLMQYAGLGAISAVLFIAVVKSHNLYEPSELLDLKSQVSQVAIKWIGVFLILAAAGFAMKVGANFSRGATLIFEFSTLFALIGHRIIWRLALADFVAVRRFSGRKIALITDKETAANPGLLGALSRHGLELADHFILPASSASEKNHIDVIGDAISTIRGSDVEEVVVSANLLNHWSEVSAMLSRLRILPIPVNLVPVGPASELFKLPSHKIGDTVTIELQRGPRTLTERLVKRLIDIVIAGTALLCFMPLFLLTAVAIKLDSPGPIMFRQRRCGFNGKPFQIFKFRTMSVLEDGDHIVQAERNDNRVTRVGGWLRRTSIDELPQLFNVLSGEMSIVGPRPHAMAHDDKFDKLVTKYAYRHHIKPGITGWAQVNGHRGVTRTIADVEQRTKLDLWYLDNWNLALDFKILFMTVIEVVRGKNAY